MSNHEQGSKTQYIEALLERWQEFTSLNFIISYSSTCLPPVTVAVHLPATAQANIIREFETAIVAIKELGKSPELEDVIRQAKMALELEKEKVLTREVLMVLVDALMKALQKLMRFGHELSPFGRALRMVLQKALELCEDPLLEFDAAVVFGMLSSLLGTRLTGTISVLDEALQVSPYDIDLDLDACIKSVNSSKEWAARKHNMSLVLFNAGWYECTDRLAEFDREEIKYDELIARLNSYKNESKTLRKVRSMGAFLMAPFRG